LTPPAASSTQRSTPQSRRQIRPASSAPVGKQLLSRDADVTGATYWNTRLLSLENTESAQEASMQVSLSISNSRENHDTEVYENRGER
jgi:hypothetical protein